MTNAALTTESVKAIRDAAITALHSDPKWKQVGPLQMRLLTSRIGLLRFVYRTGLQKLAHSMPFGLDIWAGPKVLSVQWNDDDRIFKIIKFTTGVWIHRDNELPTMQDVPHIAPSATTDS
jgi:hypothetical protein